MKKKYVSPEMELKRVMLKDNLCASEETPIIDVHATEFIDDDDDL